MVSQGIRHGNKNLVSGLVSVCIIYFFEMVNVSDAYRKIVALDCCIFNVRSQPVITLAPVIHIGELVLLHEVAYRALH